MSLQLESHVLRVLENQFKLFEALGPHNWSFDMNEGTLAFTKESGEVLAKCPVQVLGTESKESNTWLWAWANPQSNIPAALLQGVKKVKEAAARENLPLFGAESGFLLEYERLGTELAVICTGYLGMFTYYACAYEGGAMYCAIERCPEAERIPRTALLVNRVIFTAITTLEVSHRQAVTAYLGEPIAHTGDEFTWKAGTGEVKVRFDEQGRITKLEEVIRPQ